MQVDPIGFVRGAPSKKAAAPRQGVLAANAEATIELIPGRDWQQTLDGLEPFERIWVVFHFHEARDVGTKVRPPGSPKRLGVLATRTPHRPNPIGLTCVELLRVEPPRLIIRGHDLIDGTPVLDVKPYLPFADAFPHARTGWHAGSATTWSIGKTIPALRQLAWLEESGVSLEAHIATQLQTGPTETKNRRITRTDNGYCLASGTWRIHFSVNPPQRTVTVHRIGSGYVEQDEWPIDDPYGDCATHRGFIAAFPSQ